MIWLWLIVVVALMFGLGAWLGAPYLPILRRDAEPLLALAGLEPGQTLIDLGSGDGRLLRVAAKQGVIGIGYEINPLLVLISRLVCWRYRRLVTIHLANYWPVTLPPADVIYVFLIQRYMRRLDDKLSRELIGPTRVISLAFKIPGRPIVASTKSAYCYQYPPSLAKKPSEL